MSSSPPTLDVFLYGVHVAELAMLAPLQYRLTYRDEWLSDPLRMPVSLSLPLGPAPIIGDKLTTFLDNLLPDNADVRDRWAQQAGLSTAEPFELLRAFGADVAGAIQFASSGEGFRTDGRAEHLSDADIADRIRAIREDDSNWQDPDGGAGYFSLGGAQGKFSLGNAGNGWYEPTGHHPTTHIMKPRVRGFRDGELTEYLAMSMAGACGIPTAAVQLGRFGSEHTLVVERFDRRRVGGDLVRVHQEDLVQSLGVPRLRKYESHRGPGYKDVLRLLDQNVPGDRVGASKLAFVQALIYSWMTLNTDGHAKNYSVFISPDGIDLTPLYDVSSLIPYVGHDDDDAQQLAAAFDTTKLSMRIAADFQAGEQSWFEWGAVAREAGLSRGDVLAWAGAAASNLAPIGEAIASSLPSDLQTDVVARFVERLSVRSRQLMRSFPSSTG